MTDNEMARTEFDPSRVFAEMDRYLDAAEAKGAVPKFFRVSEHLLRDLSDGTSRRASYKGVPFQAADEWSWGWMLRVEEKMFHWKEHWFQPRDASIAKTSVSEG